MEIRFTELATEDLQSIKEYIFENNQKAAKTVIAHIIQQIETLLPQNPSIGRAGRILRTRELVITKYPYIVPYQVRENVIYILRILHTSRKWE
ncbi:MAG: type II toxin-antitoxin system RelE/ParE family toxin [Candidatus Gastranaerophilales bacterium]|nr:type II toxin-antitoxin system RelE/ParE family toxin [Candidatus Gastranaerophilales bacterium]